MGQKHWVMKYRLLSCPVFGFFRTFVPSNMNTQFILFQGYETISPLIQQRAT